MTFRKYGRAMERGDIRPYVCAVLPSPRQAGAKINDTIRITVVYNAHRQEDIA